MDATLPEGPRPYWFPPDLDFDSLPEPFRLAVREILDPLYKTLVLEASDPLARATGATIAHLMAIELREQCELGRELPDFSRPLSEAYKTSVDRLLRTVSAKQKAFHFFQRLKDAQEKEEDMPFAWSPPK